jgi:DNA excision repair protein ERCC-2
LCTGNAFGHWKDRVASLSHRRLPAVYAGKAQAHILLTLVLTQPLSTLLSLFSGYLLIFELTGTMSEIEKALMELKALMKYRTEQLGYEEDFRGLGLTSRKNLCLHPSVKREKSGSVVDARCRSLTAGFVKEKKERGEDVDLCVYHDVCFLQREQEQPVYLILISFL